MNWPETKTLSLIELYKNARCVWDPKDIEYYKKNAKEDAWTAISNIIEEPIELCKSKMMSLLASYRREKGRIKQSSSAASVGGTSGVYKSRWYAYDALKFLEERESRKRTNTAVQEDESSNSQIEPDLSVETDPLVKTEPWIESEVEEFLNDSLENKESNAHNRKRIKLVTPRNNDQYLDDECYHFGNFIACKLRAHDEPTRCAIQIEIINIFQKANSGNI